MTFFENVNVYFVHNYAIINKRWEYEKANKTDNWVKRYK